MINESADTTGMLSHLVLKVAYLLSLIECLAPDAEAKCKDACRAQPLSAASTRVGRHGSSWESTLIPPFVDGSWYIPARVG